LAIEQGTIIQVLISLAILLFAAKIFAEIFNKLRLPAVLGELVAGIIIGPFALGSFPMFDGKPLVILNETVLQIGEIAGLVILFIA
jgi:Kef-type K+ transport system membrane component KefB